MRARQTAGVIIMVGIVGLALGVAMGYGMYSGKLTTQTVTSTFIRTTTALPVTTTMYSTYVNTFFSTSCTISSVGGFELRIVSDSTGAPINADSIIAVDKLGCNNETQVVYLNEFSYLDGGWIVPAFPNQATVGGGLNITTTYLGKTYNFVGEYRPVGTDCVTLHVPSGNVTSSTAMNGSGSYCS